MTCPWCQKEMEKGLIQSPHEIAWLPGEKRRFFSTRAEFNDGAVTLSRFSALRGSAVRAWLCRDCGKVIIDTDYRSDFNVG